MDGWVDRQHSIQIYTHWLAHTYTFFFALHLNATFISFYNTILHALLSNCYLLLTSAAVAADIVVRL